MFSQVDLFEAFYAYTRLHEDYNLDDIVLVIPLILACLAIFAYSRSRDLKKSAARIAASHDELNQAYQRIRELSQSREQFMTVACHELKSPLISAVNALRLLEMTENAEERRELAALALENLSSLQTLIGDVLRFTRLTRDGDTVEDAPFDVRETLRSIASIAAKLAESKGLSMNLMMDDTVPEQVVGNQGWLRLICLNLLGNAVKYTESGSVTLHCGYRANPGELVIRVIDTGLGVPDDKHAAIFEPFEQVRASQYEKKEGLGLGLSVVRELVQRLDGSVTVESTLGAGSTFTVFLPMNRA
ncbi:MAG: HAMP domain-containing sensor histidine kinase [Pseudodesulfovibrio sp.]